MANIVQFPNRGRAPDPKPVAALEAPEGHQQEAPRGRFKAVWGALVRILWIVGMLAWPFARWVITADVIFQFFRMLYYWNTPEVHAGWTFALHFTVLTVLTYFVATWKPKGI